jgi:hypothetical protein
VPAIPLLVDRTFPRLLAISSIPAESVQMGSRLGSNDIPRDIVRSSTDLRGVPDVKDRSEERSPRPVFVDLLNKRDAGSF